jgi:2TM domain
MQRGPERTGTGRPAHPRGGLSALLGSSRLTDSQTKTTTTFRKGRTMDIDRKTVGMSGRRDARVLRLDIAILLLGIAAILSANLASGWDAVWLLWTLLAWAFLVGLHALAILTGGQVMDRAWQEGMLLERMKRYDIETIRRESVGLGEWHDGLGESADVPADSNLAADQRENDVAASGGMSAPGDALVAV